MAGVRMEAWTRTEAGDLIPLRLTIETLRCKCGGGCPIRAEVVSVDAPRALAKKLTATGENDRIHEAWDHMIGAMLNTRNEA